MSYVLGISDVILNTLICCFSDEESLPSNIDKVSMDEDEEEPLTMKKRLRKSDVTESTDDIELDLSDEDRGQPQTKKLKQNHKLSESIDDLLDDDLPGNNRY